MDGQRIVRKNRGTGTPNRLVKAKGSYTRSGLIIDNMLQKYDTKYDYTPGGNISRKKQSAWGVGTEGNSITDVNLSYDNEYKYDSPKPHAVTKVGSTEYTYDLDGRMTGSYDSESKFKRTFTWDEEGRLLKTVDNKHTTDYRYDANGERICKYSDLGETIYASGYYTETDGKKISKHIYIGSTRVASQVMSRSCETSTTMKRENTLYYHTDHLGSSGYVTDKKGEFYEHTEYTSSGESWVNEKVTGNANLPYKYCLKEMDNETGLYYHSARYRDARTGVWLSCDPYLSSGDYFPVPPVNDKARERNKNLPGMGGVFNSVNMNAYHYAGNNPVKYIDPDGNADYYLFGEIDLVGIVGIEISVGIVVDSDKLTDSGIFATGGVATGVNVGVGVGVGYTRRDIEGHAENIDVNVAQGSMTVSFDDKGYNGLAGSYGAGVGVSTSSTETVTLSVENVVNFIQNIFE